MPLTSTPSSRRHYSPHENDDNEIEDHVFMAIDKTLNGRLGCAYYIARHELLCCMQDVEYGENDTVESLKLYIEPTIIVFSSRLANEISGCSVQQASLVNSDVDHRPTPYEVVIRPATDFIYEKALGKLININVSTAASNIRFLVPGDNMDYDILQNRDEAGHIEQQGKLLAIASSIDLENRLGVGCMGALLGFLHRKRASEFLPNDPEADTAYSISQLEMFSLKDTMLLSANTLSSLQVIQSEFHPNVANQGPSTSGSKESLSVYGLFRNLARTPQGKANLRRIFLQSSTNFETILRRQDFISVLVQPENQSIYNALSKSLSRIKNMRTTVTALHKGIERGSQSFSTIRSGVWAALLEFCYHCIDVSDGIKEIVRADTIQVFVKAKVVLNKIQLQRMGKRIHDIVDLDRSLKEHRTVVNRGVNRNLDKVKDAYDQMEEVLARIALEVTRDLSEHIEKCLNVVFLPQLGFLVAVPLDERTKRPVWHGGVDWERRFTTDKQQYFKNDKMKELDNNWGDLHAIICDTEIEISHDLAQRVLQDEEWLVEASDICGELDSLLALAHGALQYNLSRPRMVADNIINIQGGRHILQEMTVAAYIPNDTILFGGNEDETVIAGPTMILLTGPNYSGKSVYMKQVALIVYLAQIGSFVPAASAVLGITDKILTRINTAESVSKVQSAFAIDLQQMASALKSCSNRSLLIIDEFGKGTDNCDGAGLVSGILKWLLELKSESPKVLASTHFHEIFEQGDFDQYRNLYFAHMSVRIDHSYRKDETSASTITYLYNFCQGRSTSSYGSQCAAMNGIPGRIVDRASQLSELMIQGEDLVTVCASLPSDEMDELDRAEVVCRLFVGQDFGNTQLDIHTVLDMIDQPTRSGSNNNL